MSNKSGTSATVLRALKVLNHLKDKPGAQSVKKISEDMDISLTIVHRLLTTLKIEGFVFQDPQSKLYSLGSVFIEYANKIVTELPFASVIEPWLIQLRSETDETVGFYIRNGHARLCVMEYESEQEIRRSVGVGAKHQIHEGATGRALLAFQPDQIKDEVLSNLSLEKYKELNNKLKETKEAGYAISYEEINDNVTAISAPVYDRQKRVIGAISISGPKFRFDESHINEYIGNLLNATKEIEKAFN